MSALRARVDALCRKLARELAIIRIRRLADEFCIQYNAASLGYKTAPTFRDIAGRVVSAGFRLPTFMAVHRYLERCRSQNAIPEPEDLLHAFLPWSRSYPASRFGS